MLTDRLRDVPFSSPIDSPRRQKPLVSWNVKPRRCMRARLEAGQHQTSLLEALAAVGFRLRIIGRRPTLHLKNHRIKEVSSAAKKQAIESTSSKNSGASLATVCNFFFFLESLELPILDSVNWADLNDKLVSFPAATRLPLEWKKSESSNVSNWGRKSHSLLLNAKGYGYWFFAVFLQLFT